MSRRQKAEMDFGSDSFLDIIANIVGILIILIVIAGVRVSQQAAEVAESETTGSARAIADAEPAFVPPLPLPPEFPKAEPALTDAAPLDPRITAAILAASEPQSPSKPKPPRLMPGYVPDPPQPIAPSAKLLDSIAALQTQIKDLDRASKQIDGTAEQWRNWKSELDKQAETARKTLQNGWEYADAENRRLQDLKRHLDRTKLVFIGKQQELAKAAEQTANIETLRHKLTPVSREVNDNEIHFHVKDNRVAYVPLMDLVERMKPQIARQKDWLMKYREHRGRVGPYRGFALDYVVVRERISALEQARLGPGVGRVIPMLLKFHPQPELVRESLDEALRPGSVFIRELQLADVKTTLTFWVYPDSFGTYRKLKEFAHAEGFTVAARPLQEGDVISASPWGSKSAGQ